MVGYLLGQFPRHPWRNLHPCDVHRIRQLRPLAKRYDEFHARPRTDDPLNARGREARYVPNRRGQALFGVGGWDPTWRRDADAQEHTSCYGCSRTYRNQEFHDQLTRGDAESVLGSLLRLQS